jgi:hypothetical protein
LSKKEIKMFESLFEKILTIFGASILVLYNKCFLCQFNKLVRFSIVDTHPSLKFASNAGAHLGGTFIVTTIHLLANGWPWVIVKNALAYYEMV